MKRFFVIALCIILVVSLAACSAERPANIKTENSSGTIPDSITFSDDGIWPDKLTSLNIQMIGRLVNEQEVVLLQEQHSQHQFRLFSI